ncbi:replication initiator [Micrococcus luteus]|uniref:replication initiator n=1 Tax=Micrococcus luteus TaxID=1270 RepID=UPI003BF9D372
MIDLKTIALLDEGLDARNVCSSPVVVKKEDGSTTFVRCGSMDERLCKSCAELNKGDIKRLIGSGIDAEKAEEFRFYFWTLTAGSFGRVHREGRRCSCGTTHSTGSGWAGVALNPDKYDYAGAVLWNSGLGGLWNKTTTSLRDTLPDAEVASVREWQARGTMHVHALVRVPVWVEDEAVHAALLRAGGVSSHGHVWGTQQDVRLIATDDGLRHGVRYLAKALTYTVKSVGVVMPTTTAEPARIQHFQRLEWAARAMRCRNPRCEKGQHKAQDHDDSRCCSGCPSLVHRRFGFGGHRFARTRGWSLVALTRQALKDQRKAYAEEKSHGGGVSRLQERVAVEDARDREAHKNADAARRAEAWKIIDQTGN